MKISLLIPSIYPDKLNKFKESLLVNTYSWNDIELLIDTDPCDGVSEVFDRLIKKATGDWVFFLNDDLICETYEWDSILRSQLALLEDDIWLFYPNDGLFEESFACFPIISKRIAEEIFPVFFKRYKLDDVIMDVIPKERHRYLGEIKFQHMNYADEGHGPKMRNGKVYLTDSRTFMEDDRRYNLLYSKRKGLRDEFAKSISRCVNV